MVTCPPEPLWQQQPKWRLYIESSLWLITFERQLVWFFSLTSSPLPGFYSSFNPYHSSFPPLCLCPPILSSSSPSYCTFLPNSRSPVLLSPLSCLLPASSSLFLFLCLGSICAALGKICREKKRGRIERRKTWKMDSAWALHYNGELSQSRFALPLNEASICIYSPSCLCVFYFFPLWEFSPSL